YTEDRVLHLELGRTGAVYPLGKERRQLVAEVFLRRVLKIIDRYRLERMLRQKIFDRLAVRSIANHPAQHVKNHAAFIRNQSLEIRRKCIQLADISQWNCVVR